MYQPDWDHVVRLANALAHKYAWRVAARGHTFDDLMQEAGVKFVVVRERYPGVSEKHFSSLFYSATERRFIDLAQSATIERLRTNADIDLSFDEMLGDAHEIAFKNLECGRNLEFDLREEPVVVQRYVRMVLSRELLGRRNEKNRKIVREYATRYLRGD